MLPSALNNPSHSRRRSLQAKGFVSLDLDEPCPDEAALFLELSQAQLAMQVSLQKQISLCSKMAANDQLLQFQLTKLDPDARTLSGAAVAAQIGSLSGRRLLFRSVMFRCYVRLSIEDPCRTVPP